jgi:membrane protein implicated in regulation of membrane protease activity
MDALLDFTSKVGDAFSKNKSSVAAAVIASILAITFAANDQKINFSELAPIFLLILGLLPLILPIISVIFLGEKNHFIITEISVFFLLYFSVNAVVFYVFLTIILSLIKNLYKRLKTPKQNKTEKSSTLNQIKSTIETYADPKLLFDLTFLNLSLTVAVATVLVIDFSWMLSEILKVFI